MQHFKSELSYRIIYRIKLFCITTRLVSSRTMQKKTILRPSYLHNGISYSGKVTSLYWIGALLYIIRATLYYYVLYHKFMERVSE